MSIENQETKEQEITEEKESENEKQQDYKEIEKEDAIEDLQLKNRLKELESELARYKIKHQEQERHRREEQKRAREAQEEAARKAGDIEALEKSWKEKLNTELGEKDKQIEELNSMIDNLTRTNDATQLAAEIAIPGSADVLFPHILSRLKTEIQNGKPVVRVLGKDGQPSASTLDDLKKEFLNNPAFSPVISGTKASGAGHRGSGGNGAGPSKKFEELNDMELITLRRENPVEYNKLKEEFYKKQAGL